MKVLLRTHQAFVLFCVVRATHRVSKEGMTYSGVTSPPGGGSPVRRILSSRVGDDSSRGQERGTQG